MSRVQRVVTRNQREVDMAIAYLGGATLQAIGDVHGISRERVRQLLRRAGVAPRRGLGVDYATERAHQEKVRCGRQRRRAKRRARRLRDLRLIARLVTRRGPCLSMRAIERATGSFWAVILKRWSSRRPPSYAHASRRLQRLGGFALTRPNGGRARGTPSPILAEAVTAYRALSLVGAPISVYALAKALRRRCGTITYATVYRNGRGVSAATLRKLARLAKKEAA